MIINNNIPYIREQALSQYPNSSIFLFGPRMTGKTSILKQLPAALAVDLLNPNEEISYRGNPDVLLQELAALPPRSLVTIDEVQRVPVLLDCVQQSLTQHGHRFVMSGSSARKLRRGGANLLGGRALDLKLHPLTVNEIGDSFQLDTALAFGTLPRIYREIQAGHLGEARGLLRSYYTTYLKEEIQAEAVVRSLDAFQRFLPIAVQSNGQMLEYAVIARECAVPASTVKEYYQILEDTLIGRFLWPFERSERKKARPKFYFFDTGVIRAIQGQLNAPPTPDQIGFLFETWLVNETSRINDYLSFDHTLSLWREAKWEIDLVIADASAVIAGIEFKSGKQIGQLPAMAAFHHRFPKARRYIVSRLDTRERLLADGVRILPWHRYLQWYRDGGRW